jgi:hypothetical protein
MASFTITYDDGSTATMQGDDLSSAYADMPTPPKGRTFLSLVFDPDPAPPIVTAPSGAQFAITVDDEGNVTAAPVSET